MQKSREDDESPVDSEIMDLRSRSVISNSKFRGRRSEIDDAEGITLSNYEDVEKRRPKGAELRHLSFLSIGIDLGTSNSVVAVCDSRKNTIDVLECNEEQRNPKLLRSMVGYHKRCKRVVGVGAMEDIAENEAGNTFYLTKRMLGRRYAEKVVQEVLEGKTFANNTKARDNRHNEDILLGSSKNTTGSSDIFRDMDEKRKEGLKGEDGRSGTVEFMINATGHPCDTVTPEQVNAAIISRLMDLVDDQYRDFTVDGCENIWESPKTLIVISVPANYDAPQRKATRQAAEIAGIPPDCLYMINEPTAAAIHHRECYASSPPEHLTLLVYDFGGGTLDVTVVQIGYNQSEWLGRCRLAFKNGGAEYEKKWHRIFKTFGKDLMSQGGNYKKTVAEAKMADALQPLQLPKKAVAVNVCAVEGNVKLGGYDFTRTVMNIVLGKLRKKCREQYPGITNKAIDDMIFTREFRTALFTKCEVAKIDLSTKKITHVLVHLSVLQIIRGISPIEKLVEDMTSEKLSPATKQLCKLSKVTSTGMVKDCLLRLRKKTEENADEGDSYFLEWPSNHLFKSSHFIAMENVQRIGMGAGRDAPDVLHVLRNDKRNASRLPNCFWIRFLDQDRCPKSRCFIAKDQDSVKLWVATLREVEGTAAERKARCQSRCTFKDTGKTMLVEESVSRAEFEVAGTVYSASEGSKETRNLWEESIVPIDEALRSARMGKKDINQILFVGGTTYMPRIRELVSKHLPDVPTRRDIAFGAPVVAVASGAARYGSTLCSHMSGLQDMMVTDIISRSIGLKVKRKGHSTMLHMVRKGEFLPFAHAARFHPVHGYPNCTACHCPPSRECPGYPCRFPCLKKQEKCTIEIYEGESEVCSDNAYNRRIGEFSIDLTQFDPPVTDPRLVGITVEFILDCERALTVMATAQIDERDDSQQLTQRLRMERTEDLILSQKEIRRMCRLEKFYRSLDGEENMTADFDFEASDEEDVDNDGGGVVLGSDDEEEFAQSLQDTVNKWKNSPSYNSPLDAGTGEFRREHRSEGISKYASTNIDMNDSVNFDRM